MKPCPGRKEAVALLAAGALESSGSRELQLHLENCPACRAYFSGMQQLCSGLASTHSTVESSLQPSPGFHARLKYRVQSEKAQTIPGRWIEFVLACLDHKRWVGATAVAMAVVAVVWISLAPGDRPALELARQTNLEPSTIAVDQPFDPARSSTLLAYQSAFNESFDNFEALLTRNAEHSSTGDGMTMMGGASAAF